MRFYSNSPYDPIVGVSTIKCTGFDDMMAIYATGICYAFKIKISSIILSSTVVEQMLYIQHNDHTSTTGNALLSLNQITEINLVSRRKTLYSANLQNSSSNSIPISSYVKMKSIEKKKELEQDVYGFTRTSGPAYHTYTSVGIQSMTSSTSPDFICRAFIQVTYYCKLFDKVQMTE